ncbi:Hypothetical protein CINCED_3A025446 [Cinara cedri]|uniref:Uncharacterized protein n=1 Tax=Cinara cedri TaxID=506608 RepID=A0A5E4MVM4_9HEMI|nr:Hypothetical protein CINCED_3A025446 [Cinara cedri]
MLLTSCFGLPLRTGAGIISIVNSILSIVYVLYNVWEYNVNYGYDKREFNDVGFYSSEIEDIFLNYIALVFMLVGFTSLYANLSLKQATIKNEIHKIYLWLLIEYVQLGTFITIETVIGYKYTLTALQLIGLVVCSIIINGNIYGIYKVGR